MGNLKSKVILSEKEELFPAYSVKRYSRFEELKEVFDVSTVMLDGRYFLRTSHFLNGNLKKLSLALEVENIEEADEKAYRIAAYKTIRLGVRRGIQMVNSVAQYWKEEKEDGY
ncbi:MAG TPA: hypothetical protein VJH92_02275 [Candidatus Nanoarchaeia archaeon]|nr:hypothetical protein [Candidatus Nanoarchaeia archaeon]